jgi:hypothetical protein
MIEGAVAQLQEVPMPSAHAVWRGADDLAFYPIRKVVIGMIAAIALVADLTTELEGTFVDDWVFGRVVRIETT